MEDWILFVKMHYLCTEFNTMPIIKVEDNGMVIRRLDNKNYTKLDAFKAFEDFIMKKLDAEFNENDNSFYINEERVCHIGDYEFTVNGITYGITNIYDITNNIDEYCPNCDSEVQLVNFFAPQRCPSCGDIQLPCCLCDECVSPCPLLALKAYLQERDIEIVFIDNKIRVNGVFLQDLDYIYNGHKEKFIGRKVFWLDPRFDKKDVHTSDWKTIKDINNDIVIFTDDTEVWISECYI